ncbi:MAG: 50S ribosomal protein L21 [Candidatus Marinimicrobia bacterium]|jgi:large subunit ribosomal protein L21|nr:50S ribosomal protein L21 [Candidatus Neomarinimicrobiota bacterium]
MFAIVEIYGKQYKVAKGDTLLVDSKIDIAVGKTLKFDNVKAISDKNTNIFNPKELDSYKVSAKVLEHKRASKVTIIKKKRRKGYQRKNGHRQDLTMLEIQSITGSKAKKAAPKKAAEKSTKKAAPKKKTVAKKK